MSSTFGAVDYCVFAVVFVFSGAIGVYSYFVGNKSPEEFLMGNRSFKSIPVAMSLLSSYVTAVNILGYTGEAYAYGSQLSTFLLGVLLAIIFSMYIALPVLYPLKLTSINEYINLRFKSKRLQMFISFLSLAKILSFNGIALYAPTIALASVTQLDTWTNIFLLGIICTLYSTFGGIRGVIWTDIFQLIVIMTGLVLVFVIGSDQNGGILKTFYTSSEAGRLDLFNALKINIYGMFILYFLIFSAGLVAYVSYIGCDPLTSGIITKKDEIITYFITDKLSFVQGLSGIFCATLVAGSLSTLSSAINACAALIWRDVCVTFIYFQKVSPTSAALMNKILSFIIGIIIIGLAILVSKTESLVGISMAVNGTFQGPVFGVFLIGFFLPKCNIKGVWTGFLLSSVITLWINLGNLFYKQPRKLLPLSLNKCDHLNISSINSTVFQVDDFISNITEETNEKSFTIESFYQISITLYVALSTALCIFFAIIVSCLTGNQSIRETSPLYVTPCVRKYYWKTKELKSFSDEEVELNTVNVNENNHEVN